MQKLLCLVLQRLCITPELVFSTGADGMSDGVAKNHETRSTSGDIGGLQSDKNLGKLTCHLMFSGEIIKRSV